MKCKIAIVIGMSYCVLLYVLVWFSIDVIFIPLYIPLMPPSVAPTKHDVPISVKDNSKRPLCLEPAPSKNMYSGCDDWGSSWGSKFKYGDGTDGKLVIIPRLASLKKIGQSKIGSLLNTLSYCSRNKPLLDLFIT